MSLSAKQYKITGEILIVPPVLLLIILAIGELSGSISSSIQHFLQLVPLFLLAFFSWVYPRIGGILFMTLSFVLAILYMFAFPGFPFYAKLLNTLFLFGIPFLAGTLFLLATKKRRARKVS